VSALSWVVLVELVLLGVAGVMYGVALIIAKSDPDDPIYVFASVFWREFLWPPVVMDIDLERVVVGEPERSGRRGAGVVVGGEGGGGHAAQPDKTSDDDTFYGRVRKGTDGRPLRSELAVLVEPNAAADEVVGRENGVLRVRVTGEPGESRSNKSLVEMVATAVGVKPYQITLTKGHYQTRKTVQVQGISPEQLLDKLDALPEVE
jgi:uncharacterized protein YggU (UPF0235/DUF167 family)